MPNYARTGGILTIISGAFSLFYVAMSALYVVMAQVMESYGKNQPPVKGQTNLPPELMLIFTILGALFGLFFALVGTLAITGGVFSLKRKHWAWSLAGAIAGTLLMFPCGIAGTILISLGRQEFLTLEQSPDVTGQGQPETIALTEQTNAE